MGGTCRGKVISARNTPRKRSKQEGTIVIMTTLSIGDCASFISLLYPTLKLLEQDKDISYSSRYNAFARLNRDCQRMHCDIVQVLLKLRQSDHTPVALCNANIASVFTMNRLRRRP